MRCGATSLPVKITIALGAEERPPGDDPAVLWEGDEGQDGQEILPAALCREIIPDVPIGEWCRFDDVKSAMPKRPPDGGERTGIQPRSRMTSPPTSVSIQVPTAAAAYQMLEAALALTPRLHKATREIWIRVR